MLRFVAPVARGGGVAPPPLHAPDGFFSLPVLVVGWLISAAVVGVAVQVTGRRLNERLVPAMGVFAAFIFAAQMINFTVAGGTSGHLIGGALAAILLGPWAGILTLTTVVAIQALVFQDGGLLAMGANILNMAVVAVLVGYGVHRGVAALARGRRWGLFVGGFAASWLSVVVASVACAIQLAFSGTSALPVALPAMAGVHALIGSGEGLITVGTLAFVAAARPDLLEQRGSAYRSLGWAAVGVGIALAVALFAPLASPHPDGLERVAENLGFAEQAAAPSYEIVPDYVFPLLSGDSALATILAGLLGTLMVAGLAYTVAHVRLVTVSRRASD